MKTGEIKIEFRPSGRNVYVLPGTLLIEAAGLAGIVLQTPCGGQGTCGKCRVLIDGRECLACEALVDHDTVVDVPRESLFESRQKILVHDTGGEPVSRNPRVRSENAHGAAFDIGTTTVVGTLFNLCDGRELGVASELNSQIAEGDDVISRIEKVCENPAKIFEMQDSIVGTVNEMMDGLCHRAGVSTGDIHDIVVAGNSTMQQLFCGMDISALGSLPFRQAFHEAQVCSAEALGIRGAQDAQVYVFPQVGGFIGGDTVAGVLATRLDQRDGVALLVDIGTNGEIVLSSNGRLLATSTAAGPAFEGARIIHGMRATDGAIEKIIIDDGVRYNVIGDAAPAGICGTALIDAVSGLLDAGIIDETGRLLKGDALPCGCPSDLVKRIGEDGKGIFFMLVDGRDTATGRPICLWQKDIRELQLAAGAIRSGINILLQMVGLRPDQVDEVLLAGAFGNFIRRNHACRIGLLPQIPSDRIKFVGNVASLGAKLVLLSMEEREYAAKLRNRIEHVDLSTSLDFQNEFASAMIFPGGSGVSD